jgi:hypothetical protein
LLFNMWFPSWFQKKKVYFIVKKTLVCAFQQKMWSIERKLSSRNLKYVGGNYQER